MILSRIRLTPLLLLVTLASSTPALAAYSATTPPPGWSGTAASWGKWFASSDKAAKAASKLAKGSSVECLRAIFLKLTIEAQVVTARDAEGVSSLEGISKADAKRLQAHAEKEREDSCNGPNGGNAGANAEAVARHMNKEGYGWEVSSVNRELAYLAADAKPMLTPTTPWVVELLKAGVLVQQAAEGAATRAAGLIPILNPSLFDPRRQRDTSL